ncbi:MAG: WYL domain-containing protein [Blautia sp.]|nr:WYL domain-containing protein [Blautia sp.]
MVQELNTEHKQRINLTSHARDILRNDREMFAPHLTSSGFINELLARLVPQEEASITEAINKRRQYIMLRLEKKNFTEQTTEEVCSAFLEPYRESLKEKAVSWPKGTSVIFRLNNQNTELFYDPNWPDAAYYGHKPSKYMKALLEEYASHNLYEREGLFFHEWITLAEAARNTGKLLRIVTMNRKEERYGWDLRVYGILPNEAGLFHYIVGRSVRSGGLKSEESISSFRLSRLKDVRIMSSEYSRSGSLSKAETREIEDRIENNQIQFLVGENEEFIIALTKEGRQFYRQIQYMRPPLSYIDDDGYYHFNCTFYQAFQYFYRFGERAKIIKPELLKNRFLDEYRRAFEHYNKPEE